MLKKKILIKAGQLILVFSSIVVSLGFCELLVRVNAKKLMPAYYYLKIPDEFSSQGFRSDHLYSKEKPKGVTRILGLGDSFTYGQYVPQKQTYLARLESILNDSDGETAFEVINAGHPGYNLVNALQFFIEKGVDYQPDIITIGIIFDDMNLGNFNPPQVFPSIEKHLERSYLYSFLRLKYRYLLQKLCGRSFDTPDLKSLSYQRLAFTRALEIIAGVCKQKDIRVVVLILPYSRWIDEGDYPLQIYNDIVKSITDGLNLPTLDMTPVYYEQAKRKNYKNTDFWASVDPPDDHPSILAHEMIAETLVGFLRQEKIVNPR